MTGKTGITLIEVLLAVVILSAGIVVVYQPLLSSLDAIHQMDYRMELRRLALNRIWELKETAWRTKTRISASDAGMLIGGERTYQYSLKAWAPSENSNVQQVHMNLSWITGGRKRQRHQQFYASLPYEAPKI